MSRFFQFLRQPFCLLPCLGFQFRTGRAPEPGEEHSFHPSGHLFPALYPCHSHWSQIAFPTQCLRSHLPACTLSQPHNSSLTVLSHHQNQRSSPTASLCCGCLCQASEHSTVLHQLCALAVPKWGPRAETRKVLSPNCFGSTDLDIQDHQ